MCSSSGPNSYPGNFFVCTWVRLFLSRLFLAGLPGIGTAVIPAHPKRVVDKKVSDIYVQEHCRHFSNDLKFGRPPAPPRVQKCLPSCSAFIQFRIRTIFLILLPANSLVPHIHFSRHMVPLFCFHPRRRLVHCPLHLLHLLHPLFLLPVHARRAAYFRFYP